MLYAFADLYITLFDFMRTGEMSVRDRVFFFVDIALFLFTS